jgi:hypothetical protein
MVQNELDGNLSSKGIKFFTHREIPEEILFFFGNFLWEDARKVYIAQKTYLYSKNR